MYAVTTYVKLVYKNNCQHFNKIPIDILLSHREREKVGKSVNIDYEMDRARTANVGSVPTVILVENGQEVRRFTGARSYEQVMQFING